MEDKVAVVTGANKGLGYGIVKELCRRGVGTVYLTARDKYKGEQAVETLKQEGFHPKLFVLDVTCKDSVKSLANHLKEEHGGLDILINNAAIAPHDFYKTTYEDSKRVLDTNYFSILTIQEYIYPLLNENARVVNISSNCGHISNLRNQYWIDKLTKTDTKIDDINAFVSWFLESIRSRNLKEEDFVEMPLLAYKISKIALCALTRIQQAETGRGISVNSLHPGSVRTDMAKGSGSLTIDEAAKTPAYLVLDADQSLKGKYIWFDKTEKDWTDINAGLYCRIEKIENNLRNLGYYPKK